MHAIRLHQFGPPGNLRYERIDAPQPGDGEVAVRVEAAGVHLLDTSLRAGQVGPPTPLPALPHVPGREVAGEVEEVGPGVEPAWLGRRVVVHLGREPRHGGYAERTIAAASSLHPLPDGLGAGEAVAMIGTGRTALAILETARLGADDVVLVTAAAGGLGTLLVQAALRADALVVAVAGGPEKVARASALGAQIAVDYGVPGWAEAVRERLGGYELSVVFESVGGTIADEAVGLLPPGGRLVTYGWSSGEPLSLGAQELERRGIRAGFEIGHAVFGRPGGIRGLETEALAAAARGELTPAVQTFPLAQAADAHAALEERRTVGKVVLVP
ncbi:zinc-binding dehydrogenase [Conexibacter sp. JD483]|uniref:zinc-binding dehydrogenase n=1 Tax=unclassified Conexibacter TaxID=2627773 RepID=UPI0027244ED9|nr:MULTISPECIES: zinc-binding dehydrogenase [unclassified Conexibacter]MDO8188711.1 zinc-binding dehydrogenase [Conexibacter sp. CPCC 205706]MDO8201238.1 zinc-binding dehydrogenase [Conexibacter sp. CPCC 205762]MDR9370926.1 zinc-binding dehydrogenase [Conexibacter sp. JD483]